MDNFFNYCKKNGKSFGRVANNYYICDINRIECYD